MDTVNAINGLQDLRDKYVTLTLQPKLFVFFRTFTTFFFLISNLCAQKTSTNRHNKI